MVKLLFCMRAFNDIDNIAPAIYFYLRKHSEESVVLLFYQYYDWRSDPNIAFLKAEFGERVIFVEPEQFLGNRSTLRRGAGGLSYLIDRVEQRLWPAKSIHSLFRPDARHASLRHRFFQDVRGRFPDLRAAVFDQNRHHQIGGALETLKALGIRTLALPVSPLITFNTLRTISDVGRGLGLVEKLHSYGGFDRVCFTDRPYVEYLRRHYHAAGTELPFVDRVAYVGAIRYSPEWLAVRPEREQTYREPTAKRRVALFLSQPKNNVHWGEVLRTLELLSHYEKEIEVVVKPHTRPQPPPPGVAYNRFSRQLLFPSFSNVTIEHDAPSSAILDWTEVAAFWGTSIAIEAYIKGKACINLDHVHANRTLFAQYDLPYQVRCRDDLKFLLERLCQTGLQPSRESPAFAAFEKEVIRGGRETPAFENYLEELEGIVVGDRAARVAC